MYVAVHDVTSLTLAYKVIAINHEHDWNTVLNSVQAADETEDFILMFAHLTLLSSSLSECRVILREDPSFAFGALALGQGQR